MVYLRVRGKLIHEKNLKSTIWFQTPLKGTVSRETNFTELGLTKERGWFSNFLGAPMIL
jgi:hypothetical protein